MSDVEQLVSIVETTMKEACGVPEDGRIVAACSGGADSVALVHLLASSAQSKQLVGVVFVDHGLRDVGREAAASRGAAERAGVPWTGLKVTLGQGNVQAAAREARYGAMLEAIGEDSLLATGHTMDDQAETVLQRLLRRAGSWGLGGIQPRHGRIVRPLLRISRQRLQSLGLEFAEDPTNVTDHYQRNRLRHHVLPVLEEACQGASEAMAAPPVAGPRHGSAELGAGWSRAGALLSNSGTLTCCCAG